MSFTDIKFCKFVTRQGQKCSRVAGYKCHRCEILLCEKDAYTNEYEHARERAVRKYCIDCCALVEQRMLDGSTQFVDVQPINLDAYDVDVPVCRRGPVKWED